MKLLAMGVGGLLAAMAASASADVLYSNGPIKGTNAVGIGPYSGQDYLASNSFSLSANSTVTSVDLGLWAIAVGESPKTLDWVISTTDADWTGQHAIASGTASTLASTLSSTFWGTNGSSGDPVYASSFSTGNVSLNAGTYYLMLHNGVSNSGNLLYWDQIFGPSQDTELGGSTVYHYGSESFTINGTVPEPASLSLLGVGALLLIRRHRSQD